MAYTAAQVNTLFQSILQRPADLAAVQAFAGSSQSDQQVRTQIESSQEASVNVNPVIRLYQGAFGRLPDTAGLQANVTNYINGYNINSLATSFLAGPEAAAVFGSANPTVNASFVQTIYQNALNRTGSTSELSYWVGTGKSAGQVLAEISNSSEAVNKTAVPAVTFLDAQATSALSGTGTSVTGTLYNQTATNFTFTSGNDVIVGSVNNDTLNQAGTNAGTTTTTVLAANVNTGDTINAGGGVDTLTIDATVAAPQVPGTINGLEVINLVGGPTAATRTLDFSTANGLQLFTVRNNSTQTDTITLKAGVLAGLDNVTVSATETFNFTGTTNFGSVAVANGTNTDVALNNTGITTLNVVSTGSAGSTATNTIGNLTSTGAATTLNISGDKGIAINGIATTITTVNAAAATGNVTVNLAGTGAVTATGGSGNDKFLFGTTLTSADTVVGGTGTDTIQITGANLTTANNTQLAALNTKVSGVEVLEFAGNAAATIAGGTSATSLTNNEITKLLFNTADAGEDLVTGAGSSRSYAFGELNTGDAKFVLLPGVSTVNVALEGITGATSGAGTRADIGTLTFQADPGAAGGTSVTANISSTLTTVAAGTANEANVITTLTGPAGSTYNISGSQDLTIGTLTNAGTINAAGFTGKLQLTAGSGDNDVVTIGGGGTTTTGVALGGGNDVITTSAITNSASTNVINGGDGIDTINLTATASSRDTVSSNVVATANADLVTGFTSGVDKFAYTGTISGGTVTTVATGGSLTQAVAADAAGTAGTFIATNNLANVNSNTQGTAFTAVLNSTAATLAGNFGTLATQLTSTDGALAGTITGLDTSVTPTGNQTALLVIDNGVGSLVLRYTASNAVGATANTVEASEITLVAVHTNTAQLVGSDFV